MSSDQETSLDGIKQSKELECTYILDTSVVAVYPKPSPSMLPCTHGNKKVRKVTNESTPVEKKTVLCSIIMKISLSHTASF